MYLYERAVLTWHNYRKGETMKIPVQVIPESFKFDVKNTMWLREGQFYT